jgi:phosphate/phosphite/phosphonate ABC transporter binding protein
MPHRAPPDGYAGLPRRDLLRLISSTVLFAAASGTAFGNQKRLIRFGLTPVLLNTDLDLLSLLRNYLEAATGYRIELVTRRTYQEITALLISGQLEAAWICGYPYVKYRDSLELVAVPEWNGKPLYQSYLIVGANRKAEKFLDLKGDIHAFSDPDSNSGYLVTRTLMFELGFDPETFFRKTLFTYGHRNVVRAVASDLAQSGSVDGYVWEVMLEREPELVNKTRVLRKSELLGFPPVATSRTLASSSAIAALRSALLTMRDKKKGQKVLHELGLTGFVDAPPSIFDGIAAKVAKLQDVL